jgi:hypothetical protein
MNLPVPLDTGATTPEKGEAEAGGFGIFAFSVSFQSGFIWA